MHADTYREVLRETYFNKTNDVFKKSVYPLMEQIDVLDDRLLELDPKQIFSEIEEKLNKWRTECYKTIDRFVKQKCQEIYSAITEKVNKQKQEVGRLQSEIDDFAHEQSSSLKKIDALKLDTQRLEQQVDDVEYNNFFQIDILPLTLDKNLIHIKEKELHRFSLLKLSPTYGFINYSYGSCKPLATNNQFLLKHKMPNLCLFDRELRLNRQTAWTHGLILDLCWSVTLTRFIILTVSHVFLLDENTMCVEKAQTIKGENWYSCTCSDKSLFISTAKLGSSISEFQLSPSIDFVKQWQSPHTCKKDEWIYDMVYSNENLALMIGEPKKKTKRMELRSSVTLNRLWLLRLDFIDLQNRSFRCCSLNHDEWLIIDRSTSRLFHVSKDGELKTTIVYEPDPWRACLFGANMLAVSHEAGVSFHKI